MKITFGNQISDMLKPVPSEQRVALLRDEAKNDIKNLSISLSSGVVAGAVAAGIMACKNKPQKFVTALSCGSAVALISYMANALKNLNERLKKLN